MNIKDYVQKTIPAMDSPKKVYELFRGLGYPVKYCHIKAIYDNEAKRSFEHADVNTIIAVFGASYTATNQNSSLQNIAKFVMFKRPFEEVVNTKDLLAIEKSESIHKTESYRVYPIKQETLLEEGWEYPEDTTEKQKKDYGFNIGNYTGNKWGGKYLRAPDIFFTILEKGNRYNFFEHKGEGIIVEDVTDMMEE